MFGATCTVLENTMKNGLSNIMSSIAIEISRHLKCITFSKNYASVLKSCKEVGKSNNNIDEVYWLMC
ncbi:hypothetical protein ACOSQ2_006943 [Xanthoceras sorbifolium]